MRRLLSALAVAGLLATAAPADAQIEIPRGGLTINGSITGATDYLFRGISQTRERLSLQAAVDVEHESGIYFGAFVANVRFAGTNARQEVDFLAGYRFELAGFGLDAGVIFYTYPGYTGPPGLDYVEFALTASREIEPVTLRAGVYYSPRFTAGSGEAVYVQGQAVLALPLEFTLTGTLGYQFIERNDRFGTPDYLNYGIALSRPIFGPVAGSVGFYGTDLSRGQCFSGTGLCGQRVLASLTAAF
jgi:uncharacterized protein (TIGR02001 family)